MTVVGVRMGVAWLMRKRTRWVDGVEEEMVDRELRESGRSGNQTSLENQPLVETAT